MFLVIVLYAILASTFIFAKKALLYAQPFFLIGFRMTLAGTILLAYHRLTKPKEWGIKQGDRGIFIRATLFHIYFAFTLEFWALQYVSALKTTLIYSMTPFITALLSYFLLHERLTRKKIIGVFVGLIGLFPILFLQIQAEKTTYTLLSFPDGVLLLGVISAAYAWFIVKELIQKGYKLIFINGVAMFFGGLLSFVTSLILEGFSSTPITNFVPFIGWIFLLIVSANIIFYNLFGWLLKRYTITFISFAGFLCPGFAYLYEWAFLGGNIAWNYLASLVLVCIGLFIFYQDELTKKIIKQANES